MFSLAEEMWIHGKGLAECSGDRGGMSYDV